LKIEFYFKHIRSLVHSEAGHMPVDSSSVICTRITINVHQSTVNAVFWDIKTQFVPHRRQITSLLQSPTGLGYVRFEVFTAVTIKNVVFWDIKPSSYLTRDTLRLRYRD
jgi:hypothetical protein